MLSRAMDGIGVGRGVVVLGMHRSGTSAVTGVIDALGLPACITGDRLSPRKWNARGNFESRSLSIFDELLLNHLGGTWWAPPALADGWAASTSLADLRAEAAKLFRAVHPLEHWVWKDPRACVLMQFWDLVLGKDTPRIVVLRNPVESAASLARRNNMPPDLALSLAERSLRTALRDSAGRPLLISTYDELLDDLEAWCESVASFLRGCDLPMPEPLRIDAAREFVDPSLRHQKAGRSAPPNGVTRLPAIWPWALQRRGPHESFSVESLPAESVRTAERLSTALVDYDPGRMPD
jgi:hypothetical protein